MTRGLSSSVEAARIALRSPAGAHLPLQHISHMCYTHSAASLPEVQRALFIYISYVALRLML